MGDLKNDVAPIIWNVLYDLLWVVKYELSKVAS